MKWNPFSKEKLISAIEKCNNSLISELDKLSWRHLKRIVKDIACLNKFIDTTNAYINIGHWLSHFKVLTTIIIPKPNKKSYDSLKVYQSIVLLNIISKLFEKVVSERLQFLSISNNFIHLCQLGRLKQRSTTDAGTALTYFICMDWVKKPYHQHISFQYCTIFPLTKSPTPSINTRQSIMT